MHSVKTARAYHLRVKREKITLHFSDLGPSDFGSFRVFFFFFFFFRINLFDLHLICSFMN